MPPFINDIIEFASSPAFNTLQIVVIGYIGLLWLSIIIWVTRDSINRSNSLIFQTFSILINILVPILGSILYLIIRPSKTNMERYYEEVEYKALSESTSDESEIKCTECMMVVDKEYIYCPNCATKVKKTCTKCKKGYPSLWNICPYCGKESSKPRAKRSTKKTITKK